MSPEDAIIKRIAMLSAPKRALLEGMVSKLLESRATGETVETDLSHPPLTPNQLALWYLSRLDPEGFSLNAPLAVSMRGPLDRDALDKTLAEILGRHEPLRNVFPDENGVPCQKILEASLPRIETESLDDLDEAEKKERLNETVREFSRRPFDISKGPILRLKLLKTGAGDHLLLCIIHHIAIDGWSKAVFLSELKTLYAAFSQSLPSPLGELKMRYQDYARKLTKKLSGDSTSRKISYWVQKLGKGASSAALSIPADKPRPLVKTANGARTTLDIKDGLAFKIKEIAANSGATLYTALLTAFFILIYRKTDAIDIIVGSPFAGRLFPETEGLIGYFVNTLPVRADLSGDPTFNELLERSKATVLEALENQDAPLVKIVEALNPKRAANKAPLFQTLFQLRNVPRDAQGDSADLTMNDEDLDFGISQFDLTLEAIEIANGIKCLFTYNTDIYLPETVENIAKDFLAILEEATSNPLLRISAHRTPSALERLIGIVWEDELGVEKINPHDDFFSFGANSLTALKAASALSEFLGAQVSLKTMFNSPTVARLAATIAGERGRALMEERSARVLEALCIT